MTLPSFDGDTPTMEELRGHAGTIADILDDASERVERLAGADEEGADVVEAIRHELTLSRQWNRHLETILVDVAEARLDLKRREREAAKEIARLTAIAEEARLELMTLRKALTGERKSEAGNGGTWAESSVGDAMASTMDAGAAAVQRRQEPGNHFEEMRARLAALEGAQTAAASDVDAVRAKIIEALRTLADGRRDLPMPSDGDDADLSSRDITGWAASTAAALESRTSPGDL